MKTLIALLFVGGLAAQTPPMIPMATGGGPVGGATNLTTVGSVPYVSASGTLDQDAGQFVWDATNNRLGIGTATPSTPLHVQTTTGYGLRLTGAGIYGGSDSNNGAGINLSYNAVGNRQFWIGDTATNFGVRLINSQMDGFDLGAGTSRAMTLQVNGNPLSIGTGATGYSLQVYGNSTLNTSGVFNAASSAGASYLMINNTGNVGIGTTTPGYALQVVGQINIPDTNSYIWGAGTSYISGSSASNFITLNTNVTERVRITSTGNVGIGTNAPITPLDAQGLAFTSFANNPATLFMASTDASAVNMGSGILLAGKFSSGPTLSTFAYIGGVKENATDANYAGKLVFGTRQNGTGASDMTRMTILSSGNVGIGITTPGYKLEVVGSSNTEIARVGDGTRSFGISTYTPNSGGVTFKNAGTGLISLTAANAVLIGTGYAGLGSGVPANTVAIEGNVGIGTTTPVYALDVARSGVSGTFRAYDQTATTGSTFAVFRAGVAQSGNVLEVQNNAGSNVLSISATGGLTSAVSITAGGNVNAGATQDLGWSTRSTMTSPSGGVIALYNNAQTDFNRLQFGGTTSSFPSIQRSTTKLFFRLADDSAGATVRAGGYESSDGTAGATVTTCTGFKNGLCISGT